VPAEQVDAKEVAAMQVMGFNRWEMDVPTDMLIGQALKFAEDVKE
jgi:hypothetical protein